MNIGRAVILLAVIGLLASCGTSDDAGESSHDTGDSVALDSSEDGIGSAALQAYLDGRGIAADDARAIASIPGSGADFRVEDICELAYHYDGGAALFVVEEIVSVDEEFEARIQPFVYVVLRRVEDWSGTAPDELIVRQQGGVHPDGSVSSVDVAFDAHERVVLHWSALREDYNEGFPYVGPQGVFRHVGEGDLYRGPMMRGPGGVPSDELRALVSAAYAAMPDRFHTFPYGDDETVPRDRCPAGTERTEWDLGDTLDTSSPDHGADRGPDAG